LGAHPILHVSGIRVKQQSAFEEITGMEEQFEMLEEQLGAVVG